jgi:aminopeptidase N
MTLTVACPKDWKAVSNSLEKRYEDAQTEGRRVLERHGIEWFMNFYEDKSNVALYEFEATPKISCYLYAICAGNYKIFTDYDPMSTP